MLPAEMNFTLVPDSSRKTTVVFDFQDGTPHGFEKLIEAVSRSGSHHSSVR